MKFELTRPPLTCDSEHTERAMITQPNDNTHGGRGNGSQVVEERGNLCDTSKQPIRNLYLCHVTGYQPIEDQYFLILSVPALKYQE